MLHDCSVYNIFVYCESLLMTKNDQYIFMITLTTMFMSPLLVLLPCCSWKVFILDLTYILCIICITMWKQNF